MAKLLLPCLLLILFSSALCSAQTSSNSGGYQAGFKIVRAIDSSRLYKTGATAADYLYYRPLDLDIWYPAHVASAKQPLQFRDFLGLLEQRANYYTASAAGNGLTGQVAKSFMEAFGCSDSSRILQFKTSSYKNASPAEGSFPLVIYLASYNSMAYENTRMFELLAQKGYVVVSISSIGRYPGDMTMKKEDLMEQVQDAAFAIRLLSEEKNIRAGKIGIIGYSWGGLAGALLTNRLDRAACLLSLDGSEFHHYGTEKEENEDFDELANGPEFKNMLLTLPYLRLESAPGNTSQQDSVFNFHQKLTKDARVYTVNAATHQDFSYLPVLVNFSGGCTDKGVYNTITALAVGFIDNYVGSRTGFSEVLKRETNRTIKRK